ncbi:hypothetical protein BGX24_006600 [Mortierella sp. AD032]|nr:hypothetical protein BGX24_006600 [Mortierella sp. AD032]
MPRTGHVHRDTPLPEESKDSFSRIVSKLVKAAMAGKDHGDYGDDLDKYVAEMIVQSDRDREMQKKVQRQQQLNINKAFLPSGTVIDRANSNGLKTNKRFLSSIIKSTDDHNQALIRAEEKRASEMSRELIAELDKKAGVRDEDRRAHKIAKEFLAELDRKAAAKGKRTFGNDSLSSKSRGIISSSNSSRSRDLGPSPPPPPPSGSALGSKMDKYFRDGYDPLLDTHSGDDDTPTSGAAKDKKSKSKKSRREKDRKDRKRRRDDSENESDEERRSNRKRKRKSTHKDDKEGRDDNHHDSVKKTGNTGGRKSRRDDTSDSDKSRSDSGSEVPDSRRRSTSRRGREDSRSKKKRERGSSGSEESRSRSRSMTPPSSSTNNSSGNRSGKDKGGGTTTTTPKPVTREWDLHKINQGAVHDHLFKKASKR